MENNGAVKLSIVPWISWHEYNISGALKVLIYNQREHVYYLLEHEDADLWHALVCRNEEDHIILHSLQLLIEDGIILFSSDGLLNFEQSTENKIIKSKTIPESFYDELKSEGYIFDAHWDITNKCNAKCIHCYNANAHNGLRNKNVNELSFDEAKKLIDDLHYLGVFRLVLSGGEVLTKDFFIPLCQYIRNYNIQLIIYTNGFAFTAQLLQKLSQVYPSMICFSLYGDTNHVHDSITQVDGAYAKLTSAVSYFRKNNIDTCCKNTLLRDNYHCWYNTLLRGNEIANKSMVNCTIYPSMDTGKLSKHILTEDQLVELAMNPDSPIYYNRKIKGACNIHKDPKKTPCYNLTNTIYIDPEGCVCLCIAFPCVVASVRNRDVKELKRNKKFPTFKKDFEKLNGKERLDNWRSLKISDLQECGQQRYCDFCIDVCPGDAYLLTGDLLAAPENHCLIAEARYKAYLLNETDK